MDTFSNANSMLVLDQEHVKTRKRKSKYTKKFTIEKRKQAEMDDIRIYDELHAMENLTEEQKALKKKVYNRITARESRRRKRMVQNSQEQEIDRLKEINQRLMDENMRLKARVMELESKRGESILDSKHGSEYSLEFTLDNEISHEKDSNHDNSISSSPLLLDENIVWNDEFNLLMSDDVPESPSRFKLHAFFICVLFVIILLASQSSPQQWILPHKPKVGTEERLILFDRHFERKRKTIESKNIPLLEEYRALPTCKGTFVQTLIENFDKVNMFNQFGNFTLYSEDQGLYDDNNIFMNLAPMIPVTTQKNSSRDILLSVTDYWQNEENDMFFKFQTHYIDPQVHSKNFIQIHASDHGQS